ncbi:hypothetical protein CR970_02310 [Candidatus Saccharibacteria bacterium]|nr:MAG: hypothetical protein CR970_02310 [Candidatus Saccharibacteria bacterium]
MLRRFASRVRDLKIACLVVLTTSLSNGRLPTGNDAGTTQDQRPEPSSPTAMVREARQSHTHLSPGHQQELLAAYESGASMQSLAAQYHVHRTTVRAVLDRCAVEPVSQGRSRAKLPTLPETAQSGQSQK